MNFYRKVYTEDERARIAAGHLRLRDRWNAPPFTDGQPATFQVLLGDVSMDVDQVDEAYVAKPAAAALTPAWDREFHRLGLRPEHGHREFTVYVPHALHLQARWMPCSHDRSCLGQSLLYLGLSLAMAWLAWTLSAGPGPGQQQQ